MSEAKQKSDWFRTANLLAMTWNVNCVKKSDLKKSSDFMPSDGTKKDSVIKADISILKKIFVDRKL